MSQHICNLSLDELSDWLQNNSQKPFRATQIFEWIYQKQVRSFDCMTNLSKELIAKLNDVFHCSELKVLEKNESSDGTTKFLFELEDKERIETVLIPTKSRMTVCVSTQAGCKFGCRFCASGIGGWRRNLEVFEILMQILHIQDECIKRKRALTHVVFMGIGEPFDNYDHLMKAIGVINNKKAINIGARRITISTCGVIPKIKELAKQNLQIELAISLHGYDNESRNVLMPVNRKYPFDDLMAACREYIQSKKRQITFEYILIKDVTCSDKAAEKLKKAFKGLICKMNLIPYNPVSEFDHKTPSRTEIFSFKDKLNQTGIHATVRMPRGRDVAAACGQLRLASNN